MLIRVRNSKLIMMLVIIQEPLVVSICGLFGICGLVFLDYVCFEFDGIWLGID